MAHCIFCDDTSGEFTTREHILPESLGGGDWAVLPDGLFCNACQNRFGSEIGIMGTVTYYGAMSRPLMGDCPYYFNERLAAVPGSRGYRMERQTAEWLAAEFQGLGPKQSRNLLQSLGLTRYEIPIDSRITAWLNRERFPVKLSGTALSDPHYYAFVSDGIREIGAAVGVYPCVLDAAVFPAVDGDSWNDVVIVF